LKKLKNLFLFWSLFSLILCMRALVSFAQEETKMSETEPPPPSLSDILSEPGSPENILPKSKNVTLDFKEADIRNVLKIISLKSGINIVTTPEVIGNITIRLIDVPWDKALDVIVKTYGFGYDRIGDIITVAPIEKLTELKKQEVELAQVQPTISKVFSLKYIDAQDAKKAIEAQISPRGKITVLEMTGQAGWEFGGGELGKRKRISEEKIGRSKTLIVNDIPPVIDKIKEVIEEIDIKPKQVLIETRIMEVNNDRLKDIGFDWGTSTDGAESSTITTQGIGKDNSGETTQNLGGNMLGSQILPSGFTPKASSTTGAISGVYPYNTGLTLLFQKLNGFQFETMLHALEEDIQTNTLSAPQIMALNNQEATILVGTRYPILKTDVSGTDTTTTTITLDYYQDIGIQLNVVPQVGADNSINMIIHPAVTSYTTTLGTNAYPIIETREAETRILLNNGETVIIGGLLKDVKTKGNVGIPFLSKIPFLGNLFKRETNDFEKIDLLIFITARTVEDNELCPEKIAELEKRIDPNFKKLTLEKKKKKKR